MRHRLLAGTMILAAGIGQAQAQTASGTAAGTVIRNKATATYTVNGVNQSKESNEATFVVDRKVNLTLVPEGGNAQVSVGQSGAVLKYRLTNSTNGVQDFRLEANQTLLINGANFEADNLRIFVDAGGANGDGIYDPATDTATFANELAADTSVAVFVVGDIPNRQDVTLANVTLIAIAAAGDTPSPTTVGADLTADLINRDNAIDVVFADGGLVPRDGRVSATLAYEIAERDVALTVVKSSRVVSDLLNGVVDPKALPGSVVEYCLVVNNAALLTAASTVSVTDRVPDNTTYIPNSIRVSALPLLGTCILGTPMNDDGSAVTLSPFRGAYTAATNQVSATIPALLGQTAVGVTFQVRIN